jgi:hypothetical protein
MPAVADVPQLAQGIVTVAGVPLPAKIVVCVAVPKSPSSYVYVVALAIVLAKKMLAKNAEPAIRLVDDRNENTDASAPTKLRTFMTPPHTKLPSQGHNFELSASIASFWIGAMFMQNLFSLCRTAVMCSRLSHAAAYIRHTVQGHRR